VQRVALVAGGTGRTGAALLRQLLDCNDYARIHAVTRRPLLLDHPRLANRILPLENVGAKLAGLRCDDAYCCIGSPAGRAGQLAELQQVDRDLVLTFARAAQSFGASRFIVISAAGADRASPQPFYRVKGEMEAALRELKFTSLDILQPGRVLGLRAQVTPVALFELALMPLLNPFLRGGFESSRGIGAVALAAAMIATARSQRRGVYAYSGRSLQTLATAGLRRN
jgi:uncharacterized protein YbjT (DUF2867 family)